MTEVPVVKNGHSWAWLLGIAAMVTALALSLAGWAFFSRFEQTNDRRAQQQNFNQRVREVSLDYCKEIELLKQGFREDAQEARDNLDRNLKLLNIEKTPEIVRVANDTLDDKLNRYQRVSCPRPPNPKG